MRLFLEVGGETNKNKKNALKQQLAAVSTPKWHCPGLGEPLAPTGIGYGLAGAVPSAPGLG